MILPYIKYAIDLKQKLKTNDKHKPFVDFVKNKKGTLHIRKLLQHEDPKMENFPSTLYWSRKVGHRIDTELLRKRFELIAELGIAPSDKTKLLKFSHRLVGTNSKRSKHTRGVSDTCGICKIMKVPIEEECSTNSLLEVLVECSVVRLFLENWKNYIKEFFTIETSVPSRLFYQQGGTKLDNIVQLLTSLFLWHSFHINKPPEVRRCLIFCAGKLDLLMFRSKEEKNSRHLREFLEFAHNKIEDH